MEWFWVLLGIAIGAWLLAGLFKGFRVSEMRRQYHEAAANLTLDPDNPELQQDAAAKGRKYSEAMQKLERNMTLEEIAERNEIDARWKDLTIELARNRQAITDIENQFQDTGRPGTTLGEDIAELDHLLLHRQITAEQYDRAKSRLLKEPMSEYGDGHTPLSAPNSTSVDVSHGSRAESEVARRLRDLKSLFDDQLITRQEYDEKRKEILGDM